MAKHHDITATEKLLEMIRKGQAVPDEQETITPPEISVETVPDTPPSLQPSSLQMEEPEPSAPPPSSPKTDETDAQEEAPSLQLEINSEEEQQKSSDDIFIEPSVSEAEKKTARDTADTASEAPLQSPSPTRLETNSAKPSALSWAEKFRCFTSTIIGVDIQHDSLNIAKVNKKGHTSRLLDYIHIPFGDDVSHEETSISSILQSEQFQKTLSNALAKICNTGKYEIWCSIANEFVQLYNISIPMVADKEIANVVYWSTKKEARFDEEQVILDYTVLGGILVKDIPKLSVLVYLASKKAVDTLTSLFSKQGFTLSGITTPSIAILNQIQEGWINVPDGSVSYLYLGNNKSYIDIYSDGYQLFSRDINTGITSFTDTLLSQAQDSGIAVDEATAKKCIFDAENPTTKALPEYQSLAASGYDPGDFDTPATNRLLRQLQRTFDYCTTHFSAKKVNQILISGLPSTSRQFVTFIKDEMGIECTAVDPFGSGKLLITGPTAPDTKFEKISLVTALGLALSQKKTSQNFLFTSQQKEKSRLAARINKVILSVFIILTVCCGGLYIMQKGLINSKETRLADIKKQIPEGTIYSNTEVALELLRAKSEKLKDIQQKKLALAERYFEIALLSEFTQNLPNHVELIRFMITGDRPTARRDAGPKKPTQPASVKRKIHLEGVIATEEKKMEFVLAELMKRIGSSRLIKTQPDILQKIIKEHNGSKVMHFIIKIQPEPIVPGPKKEVK